MGDCQIGSPQVRGCPARYLGCRVPAAGSPAGAGMSRIMFWVILLKSRFPRRCGDVPMQKVLDRQAQEVPPQVRGCPLVREYAERNVDGSPAGAGMSLNTNVSQPKRDRFPRRCGDVPPPVASIMVSSRVPPQVRGCPRRDDAERNRSGGSPAGAGMSRIGIQQNPRNTGFPRRCGDVPSRSNRAASRTKVPPQVRGCPA